MVESRLKPLSPGASGAGTALRGTRLQFLRGFLLVGSLVFLGALRAEDDMAEMNYAEILAALDSKDAATQVVASQQLVIALNDAISRYKLVWLARIGRDLKSTEAKAREKAAGNLAAAVTVLKKLAPFKRLLINISEPNLPRPDKLVLAGGLDDELRLTIYLHLTSTEAALLELANALTDKNVLARDLASKVLLELGPGATAMTERLSQIIDDPKNDADARERAGHVLSSIGPNAKAALATLEKQSHAPDPGVAAVMQAAIMQINAPGKYAGAATCKSCHSNPAQGDQSGVWLKSRHAKTFERLATEDAIKVGKSKGVDLPQKSADCLKCHVTAYEVAADQKGKKFDPTQGVQCESCHGPGANHIYTQLSLATPPKTLFPGELVGFPPKETCIKCHNQESPTYKPFNYREFVKVIAHPDPQKNRSADFLNNLAE